MEATLHGANNLRVAIRDGCSVTVGRGDRSTVRVSSDFALSGVHFALELRKGQVLLQDLGSTNGTFLNGVRVQSSSLRNGDTISAGQSVFRLEILSEPQDLLTVLCSEPEPLYAVLDAAREPRVLELLRLSGAPFFCLHQDKPAAEMELVAPYLVPLASQPELIRHILVAGWGKAWGTFFTCREPLEAILSQLSRSLMVTLEGEHTDVYFRYYDPRVLRVILPVLDAQQLEEFAGPIQRFFMEDEEPNDLLRFSRSEGKVKIEKLTVWPVTK